LQDPKTTSQKYEIIINSNSKQIIYSPQYFLAKHDELIFGIFCITDLKKSYNSIISYGHYPGCVKNEMLDKILFRYQTNLDSCNPLQLLRFIPDRDA
jgi:hypothetical protein